MKKKQININPQGAIGKKISIKALDFAKLPKKFTVSNYSNNAFLNLTKSFSSRVPKEKATLNNKPKVTSCFMKPITSRNKNQTAIKLNGQNTEITRNNSKKTASKMKVFSKPFSKVFTQSLYVSYNNSSSTYRNTNKQSEINGGKKTFNVFSQISMSKSSSRNNSHRNGFINSSTCSMCINSKDSINVNKTGRTIDKGTNKKVFSNNSILKSSMCNHFSNKLFNNTLKHLKNNETIRHNYNNHNISGNNISNENVSNNSYKQLGLKVKKKTFYSKDKSLLKDTLKEFSQESKRETLYNK